MLQPKGMVPASVRRSKRVMIRRPDQVLPDARPRSAIPTRSPRRSRSTTPAESPTSPTQVRCALAAYGYTFNPAGQRLTESRPEGTTTYTYDNLGRLTGSTYPGSTPSQIRLRRRGQPHEPDRRGVTTTYAYDDANEIGSIRPPVSRPALAMTPTATAQAWSSHPRSIRRHRRFLPVPRPPQPRSIGSPDLDGVVGQRRGHRVPHLSRRHPRWRRRGLGHELRRRHDHGSTTYGYTVAALEPRATFAQSSAAGATTPSGTPGTDTTAPSTRPL